MNKESKKKKNVDQIKSGKGSKKKSDEKEKVSENEDKRILTSNKEETQKREMDMKREGSKGSSRKREQRGKQRVAKPACFDEIILRHGAASLRDDQIKTEEKLGRRKKRRREDGRMQEGGWERCPVLRLLLGDVASRARFALSNNV